jgi:hypothetical protein
MIFEFSQLLRNSLEPLDILASSLTNRLSKVEQFRVSNGKTLHGILDHWLWL